MTTTQEGTDEKATTPGADQLKSSLQHLVGAVAQKGVKSLTDTVSSTVGNLDQFTEGGGSGGPRVRRDRAGAGRVAREGRDQGRHVVGDRKDQEKGQDLKQALTGGGKGKGKGRGTRSPTSSNRSTSAHRSIWCTTSGPSSPTFPGS